jgi:hypothetical protein
MKTGGFNLESTHVTDPERVDVLLAIVAIATTLSAKAGLIHESIESTPIKKHGFKEMNTIRLGIEYIIRIIINGKMIIKRNKILMTIMSFINDVFSEKIDNFYSENVRKLKIVP